MDEAAKVILSALGGALVAVAGALVGAWLQGRREHKRWLRAERLTAYASGFENVLRVMSAQSTLLDATSTSEDRGQARESMRAAADDAHSSVSRLTLLGPEEVVSAFKGVTAGVNARDMEHTGAALKRMTDAMRKALASRS